MEIESSRRRAILRVSLASALFAGCGRPLGSLILPDVHAQSRTADPTFAADLTIELRARRDQLQIWPGPATRVWRYEDLFEYFLKLLPLLGLEKMKYLLKKI